MQKMKKWMMILILAMLSFETFSQTNGCRVPNGDVYITPETSAVNVILALIIGPGYKGTPVPTISTCVLNQQTIYTQGSSNCRVCPGIGFSVVGLAVVCGQPTIDGKIATSAIVNCNLDDHSWALGLAAGALGLFVIRRKKLL